MLSGLLDTHQANLNALEGAGVPPRYRANNLQNIDRKGRAEVFKALDHWKASGRAYWLWLWGGFGAGKTHLASALAADIISDHGPASVCWFDWTRLEIAYRQRTQWSQTKERDLVTAAHSVQFLIIDDLGKGGMTDWSCDSLYQLVNARYNQDKTTIVTANFKFPDIKKHKGTDSSGAVLSRLEEVCRPVSMGNKSRRVPRWNTAED